MSIQTTPPTGGGGVWAWRGYLPTSVDEWLELRNRAIELRPEGVDVLRFSDWCLAEMRGEAAGVTSTRTLTKYRRTLYELVSTAPPPKKRRRGQDAGATTTKSAALMALGAVAGVAVAHLTGNPALAILAPVIPAPESYVESARFELDAAA